MFWLLNACTPPEPATEVPALPEAEVQRERCVDCTLAATSEFQAEEEWIAYQWLEAEYDEWGNLAIERRDDSQGARAELSAVYHGRWLLERQVLDTFVSPVLDERDEWIWEGGKLVERIALRSGVPWRATYTSDSDAPYEEVRIDEGDDGSIDTVTSFTWQGDSIVLESEDRGDDGSVDRTVAFGYDGEGRVVTFEDDDLETGGYEHIDQTWGGPQDNLLSYTRSRSDGASPPSLLFQDFEWSEDWRSVTIEVFVDTELFETDTRTYDEAGRSLTLLREFPEGSFANARTTWEWSCP